MIKSFPDRYEWGSSRSVSEATRPNDLQSYALGALLFLFNEDIYFRMFWIPQSEIRIPQLKSANFSIDAPKVLIYFSWGTRVKDIPFS